MSQPSHVVGLGASAGGLEAIERFFDSAPVNSGLAFVVIQHLSPDFKSMMNQLLARHTAMQIRLVEDGMPIAANGIYLIPARKNMVINNGAFGLTDREPKKGLHLPIDIFFHSLAESYGSRGIAVVLSGTGSDGSRGLQSVNEAGGLVMVQDLESCSFDGMPRNAIATGLADVVCQPDVMPLRILEYIDDPDNFVRGQIETSGSMRVDPSQLGIFQLFRRKYRIDFSFYKPTTINRRLERRMQLGRINSLEEYVTILENDPQELEALYRDLLVEVTHFFRDKEAFDRLRFEHIPELVQNAGEEIRVWVPGCATGEEAYSLAILLHHAAHTMESDVRIKVFATDMHPKSLEAASAAVFRAQSIVNVPEEYLAPYFSKVGDLYHLSRVIREHVVFAQHDITRDPPFTRLDLISCRNVLIYFEHKVQQRVLSTFHFGLRTNGLLFLGPSETVGDLESEFRTVEQHWRVYRKLQGSRPGIDTLRIGGGPPRMMVSKTNRYIPRATPVRTLDKEPELSRKLLTKHVPPGFLVDEYHDLIHSFCGAKRYLTQPDGTPTLNLLHMVAPELRKPMSAALYRAAAAETDVAYDGIKVQDGAVEKYFTVTVEPYRNRGKNLFLVRLEDSDPPTQLQPTHFDPDSDNSQHVADLEHEVAYMRETLRATVEELEASNEELQSTNEELVASTEELQSTNEELQSVNEELYTVAAEHQDKIHKLSQLAEDTERLLGTANISALFLDADLRIQRFTEAIKLHFDLLEHDVGRHLSGFNHRLGIENLVEVVQEVSVSGSAYSKSLHDDLGHPVLVKIVRSTLGTGSPGLVLNIVAQQAIIANPAEQLYLPTGSAYWEWPNVRKDEMWWSPGCYRLLGLEVGEPKPAFSVWRQMVHPDDLVKLRQPGTKECEFVRNGYLMVRMERPDKTFTKVRFRGVFQYDSEKEPISMSGSVELAEF